jgi:hypothetical protein
MRTPLVQHLADNYQALVLDRLPWWKPYPLSATRRRLTRINEARAVLADARMFYPQRQATLRVYAGEYLHGKYTDPVVACDTCGATGSIPIITADPVALAHEVVLKGRHHQLSCLGPRKEHTDDDHGTAQSPMEP